jgi:hypothetical protein
MEHLKRLGSNKAELRTCTSLGKDGVWQKGFVGWDIEEPCLVVI